MKFSHIDQTDLTEARLEYQTAIMNYNNAQLKILFETGLRVPSKILAVSEDLP
ncbi:MAG: hypothetical protein SFU25_06260 [Candidatus Caenarcaniphilales bacterium]|nr:hypothetical protein [Candidatus Caenarcaniphilales bacterium]